MLSLAILSWSIAMIWCVRSSTTFLGSATYSRCTASPTLSLTAFHSCLHTLSCSRSCFSPALLSSTSLIFSSSPANVARALWTSSFISSTYPSPFLLISLSIATSAYACSLDLSAESMAACASPSSVSSCTVLSLYSCTFSTCCFRYSTSFISASFCAFIPARASRIDDRILLSCSTFASASVARSSAFFFCCCASVSFFLRSRIVSAFLSASESSSRILSLSCSDSCFTFSIFF
mmetsp:Transcript_38229/g.120378  ORF Transcript_38229/g.120378 Transcript_38229/m.120378 type:complete len:235 (+) Transcript_38229:133-837(+)